MLDSLIFDFYNKHLDKGKKNPALKKSLHPCYMILYITETVYTIYLYLYLKEKQTGMWIV